MEDEASGLRTRLFSRIENGQRKYCYAIAGTKSITNEKDWIANISQLFGVSFQHIIAVRNAQILCDYYGRDAVSFVGHSLGGGVAALRSMVTGSKAITFNATGVSVPTQKRDSAFDESNIETLIMEGDELDEIQGLGAVVEGGYHLTCANGKRISVPATNWVGDVINPFTNKHQLNHMIESLERYKI